MKNRYFTLFAFLTLCLFFTNIKSTNAQDSGYVDYEEESTGLVDYDDDVAVGTSDDELFEADYSSDSSDDVDSGVTDDQTDENQEDSKGAKKEIKYSSASAIGSNSERDKLLMWKWGAKRHHSSWKGSTGLMDITEAGSSPKGTFAIGFFAGFFKYDDYLIAGDTNSQMAGNLNLRITPFDFLEFHASIKAFANHNNQEFPKLFQMIGDTDIGVKGYFSPTKLITLGLDFGLIFMNSVGEVAMEGKGTSVGFDALATFDFTEINEKTPIRAHLSLGYLFDNSGNLIKAIEDDNNGCGVDTDNDGLVEYEGCLSPVERTALGIDRNDQIKIGLGIDALLPYVSPMLEYNIDIPVNRQGFTCPQIPNSYDSCMVNAGASGMRQWLNIGARVLPPIADLAIDLGIEIGLSGYAPTVHELAAQEPYMFKFGLSYQFAPFKQSEKCEKEFVPQPLPVVAPVTKPEQVKGAIIAGMVHDSSSKTNGLSNAIITYNSLDVNPQVSSSSGRFNSYSLPAGEITLTITADGYEDYSLAVQVPESGILEQFFPLTPLPPSAGVITVTVQNEKGTPLKGIKVKASGAINETFKSDSDGTIMFESKAGNVHLSINSEDHLVKSTDVKVVAESHDKVIIKLTEKPKNSLVIVKKKRINIKRKISFNKNSDRISDSSFGLLDQVADVIIRNTQIEKIMIQGHTDNKGKVSHNDSLSEKRAKAVLNYLVSAGVDSQRLKAKGFGSKRPIAPNMTSTGRSKNRRVEFHIISQ